VVEFEIPGEALRASGCSLFEGWKRDIGEGTGNIAVLNRVCSSACCCIYVQCFACCAKWTSDAAFLGEVGSVRYCLSQDYNEVLC